MKIIFYMFLIALSSCSEFKSNSSSNSNSNSSGARVWSMDSDMIETRVVKTYIVSKTKMNISGLCYVEIAESREPCENVTFHLVSTQGNEPLEATTNEYGQFSFVATNRNPRKLKVISSRYKLKAGHITVQAGANISVILVKN